MTAYLPRIVSITPTLDTNAYATGDQLGTLMTITNAVKSMACSFLDSIIVVDGAKQDADITIYFFSAAPTVTSSDNAALNIADAEMAAYCIGWIDITASDYRDTSANGTATVRGLNFPVQSAGTDNLYAIMQAVGTPTYAASSLTLRFGFRY